MAFGLKSLGEVVLVGAVGYGPGWEAAPRLGEVPSHEAHPHREPGVGVGCRYVFLYRIYPRIT